MILRQTCLAIAAILGLSAPALACDLAIETPLKTVRFFDISIVSDTKTGSADVPLYADDRKTPAGSIHIDFTPEKGLVFTLALGDAAPVPFTPTVFDPDWGYGPWAHQTLAAHDGEWYRIVLPKAPDGYAAAWVHAPQADVAGFEPYDAVRIGDDAYILHSIEGDAVHLVRESDVLEGAPEDEVCERVFATDDRYIKTITKPETVIPFTQLYDGSCQLKLRVSYTRGC